MAMAPLASAGDKRPMSFTRIKEFREAWNLSLEKLAEDVDISVSQLSRFEKESREPRLAELNRLAARFRTTVADLIGERSAIQVPLYDWVSAGKMWGQDGKYGYEALRVITVTDLPSGDWMALQVSGDSMNRVSPDGSVILVNRTATDLRDEAFYVFATDHGEATYKRYRSKPDRMVPYSTNPDHEPIYPDGPIRVVGRVYRSIYDM